MKIAFFEIEEWEKSFLEKQFSSHTLFFTEEPLADKNIGQVLDSEILSVFIYSSVTKELINKLPNLKYITTRSTGFDHVDSDFCRQKNLPVSNVPEYGTNTVAEHTFALLLAISRKIIKSAERTRRGDFELKGLRGFDLHGKTIGVIGVGHIGKAVIRIAKGFGMNVVAYTRNPVQEEAKWLGFEFCDMDKLLSVSDIVSLHLPYNKDTHHIINKDTIRKFKKGSVLLNTARGGLVETEAILMALEEGIIVGAGIDVLEEECYVKEERQLLTSEFLKECNIKTQLLNHVLLTKEQALITPHNAFNSNEALQRILDVTVDNINAFIKNTPYNIVA